MYKKVSGLPELFEKGLLTHPFPAVFFKEFQLDDETLYWLCVSDGINTYQTSLDEEAWSKLPLETKGDLLRYAESKLYPMTQSKEEEIER